MIGVIEKPFDGSELKPLCLKLHDKFVYYAVKYQIFRMVLVATLITDVYATWGGQQIPKLKSTAV